MVVSKSQSAVPHLIASYTSPSQLYQLVHINRSHYPYCTGSRYMQEVPSGYVLVFFQSPYTKSFNVFSFVFDKIPTHFIYTSKLQLLYSCHILRIHQLGTDSSNFYIATFFLCFCQCHIFIVSVCFTNDLYLYNEMIFIEIIFLCKIIIICSTWSGLQQINNKNQ